MYFPRVSAHLYHEKGAPPALSSGPGRPPLRIQINILDPQGSYTLHERKGVR